MAPFHAKLPCVFWYVSTSGLHSGEVKKDVTEKFGTRLREFFVELKDWNNSRVCPNKNTKKLHVRSGTSSLYGWYRGMLLHMGLHGIAVNHYKDQLSNNQTHHLFFVFYLGGGLKMFPKQKPEHSKPTLRGRTQHGSLLCQCLGSNRGTCFSWMFWEMGDPNGRP